MNGKKIKIDLTDLSICDFKNHALESNLLASVKGGFPKAVLDHMKQYVKSITGPIEVHVGTVPK